MDSSYIRNFVIVAHVDHGKSTLADRLLELTGTIEHRKMREQFLDQMDLEREKGITIKMAPIRMVYRPSASMKRHVLDKNGEIDRFIEHSDSPSEAIDRAKQSYILNLIDTPGHVDFSYEVSRSLAAVEGAILLVDATQGIQAQTVQNFRFAEEAGLTIIPAVNKIDLPSAEVDRAVEELSSLTSIGPSEIHRISAKQGTGVQELLLDVIKKVPPPKRPQGNELKALIFDSLYDSYQGVVAHIRVMEGEVKRGDMLTFLATRARAEAIEAGVLAPTRSSVASLGPGEIGYLATGIKTPDEVRVGDTITKFKGAISKGEEHVEPLAGYKEPSPVVFASIFPENQDEYAALRESLGKLKLNDASLFFEPLPNAGALGRGYRAGFLGMLHMEIIAERLRREYNLKLVFSNPSVAFRVHTRKGEEMVYAASSMNTQNSESIEERWAKGEVVTPPQYLGTLTTLINERGGYIQETTTLTGERLLLKFEAPLRELIVDFFDVLKSATQGYASMVYTLADWRQADLVRLDILVTGEHVDAFAEIVPREKAFAIGRERAKKLKELLPAELFPIPIQAETEGRVIARETIPAMKKDVTGYLYGGDRTRKMKLWKKQQRGKKRLGETGRVRIPANVFLQMLKRSE